MVICVMLNNITTAIKELSKLREVIGVKDKNGTEIREGDICKFLILGDEEKYKPLSALTVIINYKNAAYGFEHTRPELAHPDDRKWRSFWISSDEEIWEGSYFEVIGSVYENPELLNEYTK